MQNSNRIFITGGAGFIGSHLVDQLIDSGYAITVLDNFSTGHRKNLLEAEKKGDLRIIEGSVLDISAIEAAIVDCNIVFHLAVECVRRSLARPLENHHVNATGTINVLEVARKKKIKRFIYCSSSEVYGNSRDSLLNEEKTVCQPTTVYGAAKLAGEYYTKAYYRTYHLPCIVVRPFNAYGPRAYDQGERAEVIPRFIIRLLNDLPPIIFGDGNSARDFTYVTEVAKGLSLLAECNDLIGKDVNIAFGQAVSILDVAKILTVICDKKHIEPIYLNARPGDVYSLHADISVAKKCLGFKASISLEEGLRQYLTWFKNTYKNIANLLETSPVNWKMVD
jgi:UDP-glucose 4-epimerase